MRNLWSDAEAAATVAAYAEQGVDEPLALRTYSARLLGREPRLVLHGGGNTSVKTTARDVLGASVRVLCVKGSGYDLATIEPRGHVALRLAPLLALRYAQLDDDAMVNYFRQNLLDTSAPNPSVETLTHAFAPQAFVDHTHAVTATAIANQPDSHALCRELYGERVAWVPYVMPGFALAQATAAALEANPEAEGLLLAHHGLFSFGESAKASYDRMIEFVSLGEAYVAQRKSARVIPVTGPPLASPASFLPLLRGALAAATGGEDHWVFDLRTTPRTLAFANGPELDYALRGVATPDHLLRTKARPVVLAAPLAAELVRWRPGALAAVRAYVGEYRAYFARHVARSGGRTALDPLPRVAVVPGHGVVGAGTSAGEASIAADVAEAWVDAVLDAEAIGRFESLAEHDVFDMEYWPLEQAKLGQRAARRLRGHIVVVTGGASGIGAATARAFAAEGAEVAILDRDGEGASAVAAALGGCALAISADVTDHASVDAAFARVAERFGGVDIVVSNAGIALAGALLDLSDETLRRSFEVNVFAHQYVAAAAVRIMRAQGFGGVLLFNVSKQAVNPGPNFGAYGTAKAALLALVRQYALEHGADGIRANAVNADRVRTGLLTDDLIAQRAEARGLSGAEYLAGNLLGREVLADDVARVFVAAALLDKTTGNVTTVDGGNVAAMLR